MTELIKQLNQDIKNSKEIIERQNKNIEKFNKKINEFNEIKEILGPNCNIYKTGFRNYFATDSDQINFDKIELIIGSSKYSDKTIIYIAKFCKIKSKKFVQSINEYQNSINSIIELSVPSKFYTGIKAISFFDYPLFSEDENKIISKLFFNFCKKENIKLTDYRFFNQNRAPDFIKKLIIFK